ncbi:hypothetical protein BTW10_04020 [Chromohalobacter japonicus]|uniref:Uncharacterized protein n=1 Tax=Chromohalobacter japonicus TaxID=223900 RepID=A0A1Q8TG62_9GAMM|nr:hypothetical protein [Chromohalobacter japonicus]OLO12638.1 hypothetical protein BTW10_04020 [Chromohalobacter japonicus]
MTTNVKFTKEIDFHLRQWQEMGERVQKHVAPVLKQQDELQKAMKPVLELQASLQKSLEPILADQEKWQSVVASFDIPRYTLPDLGLVAKQAEKFKKSIEEIISPAFEELQRSFKELPPKTQEALILLGNHGWYLDLEMPIPSLWKLKRALEEGSVKMVEEELVQYFEERLDEIETSVVRKFPAREKVIRAAFLAHRRCEYELSVPVFLSQTDGICKEVVNEHFFMKQNRKPRTAIYVEKIAADTYRAALLSPLAHSLPIGASERERGPIFAELNRHMVLHGESLDYGTKTNSLKAISLINYVAHVLKYDDGGP